MIKVFAPNVIYKSVQLEITNWVRFSSYNCYNQIHTLLFYWLSFIYVLSNWFLFLLALEYLWMNFLFGSFSSQDSNFLSLFSSWLEFLESLIDFVAQTSSEFLNWLSNCKHNRNIGILAITSFGTVIWIMELFGIFFHYAARSWIKRICHRACGDTRWKL